MYALYRKEPLRDGHRYQFAERVSLFGCNNGYIPWLLAESLVANESEPLTWHLTIDAALQAVDQAGSTLVINLKPNSSETNLSLYEVVEVFGYSSGGWTPAMLYLKGLLVDENSSSFDEADFVRSRSEIEDPIFSMMYLNGTVRQGQLEGRWTTPGPSSTNSVMLWPEVFRHFAEQASAIMARKCDSSGA